MTEAALDTKGQAFTVDLAALRQMIETQAKDAWRWHGAGINPWTVLSLLDRIEELEGHEHEHFGGVLEHSHDGKVYVDNSEPAP